MAILTREEIKELQQFDTPTVSNAIETFEVREPTEGFTKPGLRQIIPYKKPMVGYACTAQVSSLKPPTRAQKKLFMDYFGNILNTPDPTIAVIQDIDPEPVGSLWGEVMSTTHRALGCVGTITEGGVRDIDEVEDLKFGYFATNVLVSHAYVHIERINCPVEIRGLKIEPGDLIHVDRHGAILIPEEIAPYLADACRKIQEMEAPVINGCRERIGKGIELNELRNLFDQIVHFDQ